MLEKEPKSFKISELCKLISSFNTSQNISSFKNPHIKIEPIIITQGPKSLKLLYSIMNLNTISLPTKREKNPPSHPATLTPFPPTTIHTIQDPNVHDLDTPETCKVFKAEELFLSCLGLVGFHEWVLQIQQVGISRAFQLG